MQCEGEPSRQRSSRRHYHGRHRTRSHQQAHADAGEARLPPVLNHPLVAADEPTLIVDAAGLSRLIAALRAAGSFGYDTEFIGEHTYHPKLCVLQVATELAIALIDPLQGLDLMPFWELLGDKSIEKIVHAGLHDLEPAFRHLERPPLNVFDTQIAAGFAGFTYPMSTAKLMQELTGADPGAGLKFSQWDHRPLSPVQVAYAANDVRYLPLMRRLLGERIESHGNTQWAAEECACLSQAALYQFDAQSQRLRVRGVERLNRPQRAVLQALLAWRENAARTEDLPPRSLLRDEILYALASDPITSARDLDRVRGLPRPVEQRYGQTIAALTAAALAGPHGARAETKALIERADRAQVDDLWKQIERCAAARHIDSRLVASKKDVTRLVAAASSKAGIADDNRLLRGWRRELLSPVLQHLCPERMRS